MPALPNTACVQRGVAEQTHAARAHSAAILACMPQRPDVTVAAVTEDDGRFLFVEERINHRLVLNQPAGHVERGETLIEAVIREAREETAWRFEPQALLGAYLWRNPVKGRVTLRFAFIGKVSDHKPHQPLDNPVVTTHWLTRDELMERNGRLRSPLVLRCVDDYLGGHRQPLESVAELDLQTAISVQAFAV
jgi:8-oxo-dGTP pyrophosphatase MutT (NUDIX family)